MHNLSPSPPLFLTTLITVVQTLTAVVMVIASQGLWCCLRAQVTWAWVQNEEFRACTCSYTHAHRTIFHHSPCSASVHQQQFTLTRAEPRCLTLRQCQKNEFDVAEWRDECSFSAVAPAKCQEVPGGAGRHPTAALNGCFRFKEGSGKYRGTTYVNQYV